MRRRTIESRDGDPAGRVRKRVEARGKDAECDDKLICRRLKRKVVEPQHTTFVVRNLCATVVVGREVSMRDGVRMVVIRFVDVLRSGDGREYEPGRQREHEGCPPGRLHTAAIMSAQTRPVKRRQVVLPTSSEESSRMVLSEGRRRFTPVSDLATCGTPGVLRRELSPGRAARRSVSRRPLCHALMPTSRQP